MISAMYVGLFGSKEECNHLYPGIIQYYRVETNISINGKFSVQIQLQNISRYLLLIEGKNRVSIISNTSFAVATEGECYFPKVDISNPNLCIPKINCDPSFPNALMHYRSESFWIKSNVIYFCSTTQKANYEWTINYYNQSTNKWVNYSDLLKAEFITRDGKLENYNNLFNSTNIREIYIEKRSLEYGLYTFCLKVTMDGEPGKFLII